MTQNPDRKVCKQLKKELVQVVQNVELFFNQMLILSQPIPLFCILLFPDKAKILTIYFQRNIFFEQWWARLNSPVF